MNAFLAVTAFQGFALKTSPVTSADLRASVIAVPPMPRRPDGAINPEANGRLLGHLRAGRVTTFMYGGNANFYNLGVAELGRVLDALTPLADGDWLIPSVGADFGKAAEQIDLLRERAFPRPWSCRCDFRPTRPVWRAGWQAGSRYGKPGHRLRQGRGLHDNADLAALVQEGSVCAVKYAIVHGPIRAMTRCWPTWSSAWGPTSSSAASVSGR